MLKDGKLKRDEEESDTQSCSRGATCKGQKEEDEDED